MKTLIIKDKKLRLKVKTLEKQYFILQAIFRNLNFFTLIRWNAFAKLKNLVKTDSKISISNRCLYTVHRKRLNSLTPFSRHVFLKLARSGKITGLQKSSW